jgi:small subunit ribosomal protein S18
MRGAAPSASPRDSAEELERHKKAVDLTKQIARRWRAGDVYAPHDLSSAEMRKWKTRGKPSVDVLDVLQLDPLVEYRVCFPFWTGGGG